MQSTHKHCSYGYPCCNMSRTSNKHDCNTLGGLLRRHSPDPAEEDLCLLRATAAEQEEAAAYAEQGEAGIDIGTLGPLQMSCRI